MDLVISWGRMHGTCMRIFCRALNLSAYLLSLDDLNEVILEILARSYKTFPLGVGGRCRLERVVCFLG